jgi:tetratricopeptide (TPR) repeat protein
LIRTLPCLLLIGLLLFGAAPALLPVPPIDTAAMEPAVREQIETERKALEGAVKRSSPELAEAYGHAGRLYVLYKLNDAARACFENAAHLAPADPRWAYLLGTVLQVTGDFQAAEARLGRALELKKNDPATLIRLGEVRLQLGKTEEARKVFEAALVLQGAAAAAHFGLGRLALAQGDAAAAAGHFEAALASQPGASEIRSPLGLAYRKLGRLDDARAALAGYGDGRVTFPDPLLEQAAALSSGSRQYVAAGTTALREKRFADAAEAFRKALETDPKDGSLWANYGVALAGLRDLEGAERSYRKAIEVEPANARAHYNLGTLLAGRGAWKEAIDHLEAAVRLDPDSRDALFNLGQALAEAGEPARALAIWDRLLKLNPNDVEARFHHAQSLAALGRPEEAAAEFATVIAAAPREPAPRLAQATALLAAGHDAEARARLEEGIAILPESEALAQLLVRILAASSHPEVRDGAKAWSLAQRLLTAGSTPEREEAAALALGELGRFPEALDHQRRALAGTAAGTPGRQRLETCLALYEKNQPCRAP